MSSLHLLTFFGSEDEDEVEGLCIGNVVVAGFSFSLFRARLCLRLSGFIVSGSIEASCVKVSDSACSLLRSEFPGSWGSPCLLARLLAPEVPWSNCCWCPADRRLSGGPVWLGTYTHFPPAVSLGGKGVSLNFTKDVSPHLAQRYPLFILRQSGLPQLLQIQHGSDEVSVGSSKGFVKPGIWSGSLSSVSFADIRSDRGIVSADSEFRPLISSLQVYCSLNSSSGRGMRVTIGSSATNTADCLLSSAMLVSQLKHGGFDFPWCAHGKKQAQLAICSSHAKWVKVKRGMHLSPNRRDTTLQSHHKRPNSGVGFSVRKKWNVPYIFVGWVFQCYVTFPCDPCLPIATNLFCRS